MRRRRQRRSARRQHGSSWIARARQVSALAVAEALGLEVGRPAGGRPTYQCPHCGQLTRHTKRRDKRGAMGFTDDGAGWRCHQCDAAGDGIDMVAFAVGDGRLRELRPDGVDTVRSWFAERWPGVVDDDDAQSSTTGAVRPPAPPPAPVPRRTYPPGDELAELWKSAASVVADDEVSAYLVGRALQPENVAGASLARAVAPNAELPRWCRSSRGMWPSTGHRLLVPLFDGAGKLRSVVARAAGDASPKSLAPAGHSRRELVMLCPLMQQVLELGGMPPWWDSDVPLRVFIAEGEPDFLTFATSDEAMADGGDGHGTVGHFGGVIPRALVQAIPRGAEVYLAEQRDEPTADGRPTAAEQYTHNLVRSLRPRADDVRVRVMRP